MTFYDVSGKAFAYSEDAKSLYGFDGRPLGHFLIDSLYNYSAVHLGFLQNGWIRGNQGEYILFSVDAIGGPDKPSPDSQLPEKLARWAVETKGQLQTPPPKPTEKGQWLTVSALKYFT
jgi:hypothetical protein